MTSKTWRKSAALLCTLVGGCGDHPLGLDREATVAQQEQIVAAAPQRDRPTFDDATIAQWPAVIALRDAPGDGLLSDGRGSYSENGKGFTVAYDYSVTSSKEDRIFLGLYGKGASPRFFRLSVPGMADMDCGWGQYLVSSDDLFDQPSGATVTDGHLMVRCGEDKSAPLYELMFDPCVRIENQSADRYIASTDGTCLARVAFDNVTVAYVNVPHSLEATLDR